MRVVAFCLGLAVVLLAAATGAQAQTPAFPMKQLYVVNTINGKNVRTRNMMFSMNTISPQDTPAPSASGFAGCNRWQALFTLTPPDGLQLRDIGATKKLCPDNAVMQVEGEFLAALAKISHWREEGRSLTLTGDGTTVQFSRQGPR